MTKAYREGYRHGFQDAWDLLRGLNTSKQEIQPATKEPKLDTDIECSECGRIWNIAESPITRCANIMCPF